jgi:hypothetical protein
MIERNPPKLALWLLKHCGASYHSDSLAGDLIEQYGEGRSSAWCWRQVVVAIVAAQGRSIRSMPWTAACAMLSRLFAEVAAVLALTVIVDQARKNHSPAQMLTQHFAGTLAVLITVAVIGFLVSIRTHRRKQAHAAISALMLAFGVIALGLGTITWAATLRGHEVPSPMCSSNK